MFIDEAVVRLQAGRGGNGCVSFHREKFVPHGGPDGGDGGNGGSIFLEADSNLTTLYDFTLHPTYRAEDGKNGGGNKRNGRAGKDLTVRVPVGTQVFMEDQEGHSVLAADILAHGQRVPAARGGRGGGGNARFASAKTRLPRFALRGASGESNKIRLSLKLLTDLAIVGLPNCGKSTLLAALTAARPKIADYPFTTLTPNLGVVRGKDGSSIILADIPGLVEGAHDGRGLGNRFLKHIDRSRMILILLDAGRSVEEDFNLLRSELTQFNPEIWDRPRIVAVNKTDLVKRPPLKTWAKQVKESLAGISAKTGEGIEKLLKNIEKIWGLTKGSPATEKDTATMFLEQAGVRLEPFENGVAIVSRTWQELATMIPKDNREAIQWFTGKLRSDGIFRQIQKAGYPPGSTVRVGPLEINTEGA